jgi:uncharacterized protein YecE (DUF72 family)
MAKAYIGCPLWAHAPWRGRFFTAAATREQFLPQYASVFSTTEGNATFYGLPSTETVARWAEEAPAGFRFCFKFPRTISHDKTLLHAEAETEAFFARLRPLRGRLGPFFLQVHERFGPENLNLLTRFLDALPTDEHYAVEVRSRAFFDGGDAEVRFDDALERRGVDRVIFDTRGLFASTAEDPATLEAKRKKPRVPVRFRALGGHPFVRFVGDPDVARNAAAFASWAEVVAAWVEQGREPFFFLHHPDDLHAPELGRAFQAALHRRRAGLFPAPPAWPVEGEAPVPTQLSLF